MAPHPLAAGDGTLACYLSREACAHVLRVLLHRRQALVAHFMTLIDSPLHFKPRVRGGVRGRGSAGAGSDRAGGVEAIVCAKAIATGCAPPTINYNEPDPDCDLAYTPNTAAELGDITHAASGNLGFGGHNAALSFRKLR